MPASDESDHPWCTTPRFEFHAWVGPRTLVLANGRDSRKESLEERFPSLGATLLGARVEHLVYGARLERDTRSGAPHWTRGWRAGFEPERFHDLDLAAGRLTYLFPMGRYLEMDLHSDAGGVYPDLSEARLATLKGSYGAALRIRSVAAVLGQIGVDWSSEKVRFGFS